MTSKDLDCCVESNFTITKIFRTSLLFVIAFACFGLVFFDYCKNNYVIIIPATVVVLVLGLFVDLLRFKSILNVFGEIGFLYLFFAVVYTVAPAYGFLYLENLSSGSGFQNLALLLPSQNDLGLHLWRHVLFVGAFSFGYLIHRGSLVCRSMDDVNADPAFGSLIRVLFAIVVFSVFLMSVLSAPVETYLDNYTRYNHLPWIVRRIVTFCVVFKMGGSFVLLSLMFRRYAEYKNYIWCFILFMSLYEIKNSSGSRIEAFFLLLAGLIFYHFYVKPVTLKKGVVVALVFGAVFSFIENFRSTNFDLKASRSSVSEQKGMPAGELGAVYFTGFHLYSERKNGSLPDKELPMFFNDFISVMPFVDQTRWHPMYWYAKNYFPEAIVPPQTLSPIADSAIWGGEIDLFFRSFINGLIFAWLAKWFSKKSRDWRVFTVYVFCCATCIMCLKYSIFFHLVPVVKIVIPVIFVAMIIKNGIFMVKNNNLSKTFFNG